MRYVVFFIFFAVTGPLERAFPVSGALVYQLVIPQICVLSILYGWPRTSFAWRLILLLAGLSVGWLADWSFHSLAYQPDSAVALRAGLILLGIRAGIGAALMLPGHFGWRNRPMRMDEIIRLCAFFGVGDGALAGALLFESHGVFGKIGGAIGGGILGLPIGILLGRTGGLAIEIAKYPTPTFRPSPLSRRRLLVFVASLPFAAAATDTGVFLFGSAAQRSRVFELTWLQFAVCAAGLLFLTMHHRRHPLEQTARTLPRCDLREFSANFDSDMVRPFLMRIGPFIEFGFGEGQIEQVCQLVATLKHDEERTVEFPIRHAGEDATLGVHVVMDDTDAPDVYFFSPPGLHQQIEAEFRRFSERQGI
jgi:hypothetical protein